LSAIAISRLTVSFTLSAVSFDDHHRNAGPFGNRGVIGEIGAPCGSCLLVRRKDRREGEGLRRLGGIELCAGNRFDHRSGSIGTLEGVGDGHRRQNGIRAIRQGGGNPVQEFVFEERPYRVMDQDMRYRLGLQMAQARQHRLLARGAAVDDLDRDGRRKPAGRLGE
jgi:hypothetical protein